MVSLIRGLQHQTMVFLKGIHSIHKMQAMAFKVIKIITIPIITN
jgi:hypothetical protein